MEEIINSGPVTPARRLSGRKLAIVLVAFSLILGALSGYLVARKQYNSKTEALNTKLNLAQRDATFIKDRFYFSDKHDFALLVPKHWVKNFAAADDDNSAKFVFRQNDSYYQSVFTIFKCKNSDYLQTRGQTEDPSKCPGELIKQNVSVAYTWKASDKKYDFISELGNSDKIIQDWQKVMASFQIVD